MILVLTRYYLPGYKAGGPILSVSNIIKTLHKDFKFKIFCSDRDFNDNQSYNNVKINKWNILQNESVFYCTTLKYPYFIIRELLKTSSSVIYLNSFFCLSYSIIPLLFIKYVIRSNKHIVIAPRGELAHGPISIKKMRKRVFLFISKFLRIHANVHWHFTSDTELSEALFFLGETIKSYTIASNISQLNTREIRFPPCNNAGKLRIVFFSRICVKKNLLFLLEVLSCIKHSVTLSVFGPTEDKDYWNKCIKQSNLLNNNIEFIYKGVVDHSNILRVFLKQDLFVLPTLGENYCHAIYESLSHYIPVLISDNTPWVSTKTHVINCLSLEKKLWVSELNKWAQFSGDELLNIKNLTKSFIEDYNNKNNAIQSHREMFQLFA